jgi:hypothetical protein
MEKDRSLTSLEGRINARATLEIVLTSGGTAPNGKITNGLRESPADYRLDPDMIYLSSKRKYYFRDFLTLSNERFLEGVYVAFLRRSPDASARTVFNLPDYPRSARLRIVLQVYDSEERRTRATTLYHAWFWRIVNKCMGIIYPVYRKMREIMNL